MFFFSWNQVFLHVFFCECTNYEWRGQYFSICLCYYYYYLLLDLLLLGETHQCKHCFSRVPRGQTKKHQNSLAQVHEGKIQIKIITNKKCMKIYKYNLDRTSWYYILHNRYKNIANGMDIKMVISTPQVVRSV